MEGGPTLAFQAAPGYVAPEWPSTDRSQQFHLDLTVEDLDAARAAVRATLDQLEALGIAATARLLHSVSDHSGVGRYPRRTRLL